MALVGARGIREALSEELTFELGPQASGGAGWGEGAPGRVLQAGVTASTKAPGSEKAW